jgi:uncharacterized protein YkwD
MDETGTGGGSVMSRWLVVLALTLVSAAPTWPADAASRALAALNARRQSRGVRPLAWDPGLARAAAASAVAVGSGREQPHAGFPTRVRNLGWPYADCRIRNRGFGNVSEGISFGITSPSQGVTTLDDSPLPWEGHRRDFEDPTFTHVGIGFAPLTGGIFARYGNFVCVVDYGARCPGNR